MMDANIGFFTAMIAGIISFLSPCVLPIVPPYLCFMAGVSARAFGSEEISIDRRWAIIRASIFFVAGFGTIFVALGASASLLGSLLLSQLTFLSHLAGIFIILMGLHFLGFFRFAMLNREWRFQGPGRPVGFAGAYAAGLAFGFGWTPCIGPILATILFLATDEANIVRGTMLLVFYALGLGIPFILAGIFAGSFMKLMGRLRTKLRLIEKITGILLIITGILFLSGAMASTSYWLLEMFPALQSLG